MTADSATAQNALAIRRMTWRDLPAVLELEASLFPVDAWSPEQFWSELAHDTRAYFVLLQDDHLAGYGGVMTVGATADLQTIAIAPTAQGLGAGRRLLNSLIDCAEARACTEMLLEVRSDNAVAIRLYESQGFEAIAKRTDYYGFDASGAGIDALIMRLRPLRGAA